MTPGIRPIELHIVRELAKGSKAEADIAWGGAAFDQRGQSVFERRMSSDLIRGWIPVRVKKTRQNKSLEPSSDSIRTEQALVRTRWHSGTLHGWRSRLDNGAPRHGSGYRQFGKQRAATARQVHTRRLQAGS